MIAAYLIAMIVGGSLLASSLFFDHHGAHAGEHAGHAPGGAHDSSFAWLVLSLRFWTYLLAFGGAAGFALHLVAHLGEPLAGLLALGTGAASGIFASLIVRRLGSQQGGTVSKSELVYRLGTMLLPAAPGEKSRVRVTVNNQSIDLTATADEPLAARDEVLVLEINDGVAKVARNTGGKK